MLTKEIVSIKARLFNFKFKSTIPLFLDNNNTECLEIKAKVLYYCNIVMGSQIHIWTCWFMILLILFLQSHWHLPSYCKLNESSTKPELWNLKTFIFIHKHPAQCFWPFFGLVYGISEKKIQAFLVDSANRALKDQCKLNTVSILTDSITWHWIEC